MNNDQINIELIKAISRRPQALVAHTFIQKGSSFSRPVWLECEDGKIYVVKGRHAGRSIFNDQMIARLGRAMNAPVGVPAFGIFCRSWPLLSKRTGVENRESRWCP